MSRAGNRLRSWIFFLSAAALGVASLGAENPDGIGLSPSEKAWIAANPVVRVGHDSSFAPYSFFSRSGELVGIDAEYLGLLSRITGIKFENTTKTNWPDVVEAFRAGEVDMVMSLGLSEERREYLTYTDDYLQAPNVIVTRSDSPYVFDPEDLNGRIVAIPRGYAGLVQLMRDRAPEAVLLEVPSAEEALRAVVEYRSYAAVGGLTSVGYILRQKGITDLHMGAILTGPAELYMGVRKDWPELVSILNRAIAAIPPEDAVRLGGRWVDIDYRADLRWVRFAKVAAAVAGVAIVFFGFLFWHDRRLARELEHRRRIQLELEAARDQLAGASEEKSELMRMIAHDLRSPLGSLMIGVDVLEDSGAGRGTDAEVLKSMRMAMGRLKSLTSELLDVDALESGKRTLSLVEMDAGDIFGQCISALADVAAKKRIMLKLSRQTAATVVADPEALKRVLENLLGNAIKFSPAGSTVDAVIEVRGGLVRFSVRDQGPGLSETDRVRLFGRYAKGSAKPTATEESIGLGLWIVRRLVEAMNGKVDCESEPGHGAAFFVELRHAG